MSLAPYAELFAGPELDPHLHWWNPPGYSAVTPAGALLVRPDAGTDFWRTTHYGYDNDNGHCLFADVAGDFILTTAVRLRPVNRYDQAGLMVRLSRDCWLKTTVEYEPGGPAMLGAVATNYGYSDWSNQSVPSAAEIRVALRIRREGSTYFVEHQVGGDAPWTLMRMTHLFADDGVGPVQCGLYACSPIAAGGEAEFEFLRIEAGRLA